LGGLGATEGPPVTYNWTTAGPGPRLLPWLAILALLALKPNRGWAAWWIWLPLAVLAGGFHWLLETLQSMPGNGPGEAFEIFLGVPVAWGFGLAALWLLASRLDRHSRLHTLLGSLAVLAVFIVFSFAATIGWGLMAEPLASLLDPRHCAATANAGVMALPLLVPLVLPAPVVAAALALCGLACRGRYRPIGLWFWLVLSLLAGWLAVSALLYQTCHSVLPGLGGYAPFLGIGLFMAVVTFVVSLPFLILASASPFFRERLKALLHVKPAVPAAVGAAACLGAVAPAH
jgi:hypothetical protein